MHARKTPAWCSFHAHITCINTALPCTLHFRSEENSMPLIQFSKYGGNIFFKAPYHPFEKH